MGGADLDDLPRVDGERDSAQRAGHRGADDAQHHGALPARRVRLPQPARAARDDRGEEARLRRHAALRRAIRASRDAGRRDARARSARPSGRSRIDPARAQCAVEPRSSPAITRRAGARHDLPHDDRSRRQHGVAHPEQLLRLRHRASCPTGAGFMLQNRGALFTLEPGQPEHAGAAQAAAAHDHPGLHGRRTARASAFGIMGGWNQAQAHAQFVADIADFGLTPQEALEAGRFTQDDLRRAATCKSRRSSPKRPAPRSSRSVTSSRWSHPAAASSASARPSSRAPTASTSAHPSHGTMEWQFRKRRGCSLMSRLQAPGSRLRPVSWLGFARPGAASASAPKPDTAWSLAPGVWSRSMSLSSYLEFATHAAWIAGQSTLAHFQTGVDVELKADRSPVTVADRGAETILRELIAARFPGHAVLGEEYGQDDRRSLTPVGARSDRRHAVFHPWRAALRRARRARDRRRAARGRLPFPRAPRDIWRSDRTWGAGGTAAAPTCRPREGSRTQPLATRIRGCSPSAWAPASGCCMAQSVSSAAGGTATAIASSRAAVWTRCSIPP